MIVCFSLCRVQTVLKQHANDNPKLAYTGQPIVKWPERVSRNKYYYLEVYNKIQCCCDDDTTYLGVKLQCHYLNLTHFSYTFKYKFSVVSLVCLSLPNMVLLSLIFNDLHCLS